MHRSIIPLAVGAVVIASTVTLGDPHPAVAAASSCTSTTCTATVPLVQANGSSQRSVMVQDTRVHIGSAGFSPDYADDYRVWFRPDLTALTGYTITSASLSFVQDYSNGDVLKPLPGNDYNTLELHDAGTDWSASSDPSVISASVNPVALASSNVPADLHDAPVTMDVTASTESWAGGAPEQGLSLLVPGGNGGGASGLETYPTSFQWTVTYVGSSRPNAPCTLAAPPQQSADPAITAAPRTPEWVQQYAAAIRTSFALPATSAVITAAAADPAATSTSLGTPLTQSEEQGFEATQAVVLNTAAVDAQAATDMPTTFAGAYYSYTPAAMILMLTGPTCPDSAELAKLSTAAGVTVLPVLAPTATTYSRLLQLDDGISADLATLKSLGVIVTNSHVDVAGDRELVTLDPSSSATAVATMVQRYGAQGLAFTAPAGPARAQVDRRNNPDPSEVIGGQDITDGNARCTSNISADLNGAFYTVTAGHCWTAKTFVSQNGAQGDGTTKVDCGCLFDNDPNKNVGQVNYTPVHPDAVVTCDCELVGSYGSSKASYDTLVNGNKDYFFGSVANSDKYYSTGYAACLSGVTEYIKYGQIICGKVTSSGGTFANDTETFNYTLKDPFAVTYQSGLMTQPGDSGSPIGHGSVLLGVHSAAGGVASKARHLGDIGNVDKGALWFGVSKVQ